MKPKEFIQRLKNLKIRRFEKNEYANSIGGGTGLTGNLLDDWVTAVTQGEYTKYEEVPLANEAGLIEGWRRPSSGYSFDYRHVPTILSSLSLGESAPVSIIKDGTFKVYAS